MANINLTELFSNIANSIRAKDGTTDEIKASDFPDKISALPVGGGLNAANLKLYIAANQEEAGATTQSIVSCFHSLASNFPNSVTCSYTSSVGDEGTGARFVTSDLTYLTSIPEVDKVNFIFYSNSGGSNYLWFKGMPVNKISDSIMSCTPLYFLYRSNYNKTSFETSEGDSSTTLGFNFETGKFYQSAASSLTGFALVIGYTE